jgi:hypothetical protein
MLTSIMLLGIRCIATDAAQHDFAPAKNEKKFCVVLEIAEGLAGKHPRP